MNNLEQLKKISKIVADTGEFEEIKQYQPIDATTNPSLILAATKKPQYKHLLKKAIQIGQKQPLSSSQQVSYIMDQLSVQFGIEILNTISGRVSTEIDARLSFDIEGSLAKAESLIQSYEKAGINRERILIKLASTWEGIQVARQLEKKNIHCNMTLIFNLAQAIGCGEAKATLISPFVGRILDWHKKHNAFQSIDPKEDPGVISVTQIYNYYKKFGYQTDIMAASFRNIGEILELAGCDLLTLAPKFLHQLQSEEGIINRKLSSSLAAQMPIEPLSIDEKKFRWLLCNDPMANDKLCEGIRSFSEDSQELEKIISASLLTSEAHLLKT